MILDHLPDDLDETAFSFRPVAMRLEDREHVLRKQGLGCLIPFRSGVARWGPDFVAGCGGLVVALVSMPVVFEVACR